MNFSRNRGHFEQPLKYISNNITYLHAIENRNSFSSAKIVSGEPIVTTPENAFNTFKNSGMDMLVLGNHIVKK